jgi:2-polyprenyl-3-methyl-5-hydroxy-6-metoxy-1,4-benzoquinol methylase
VSDYFGAFGRAAQLFQDTSVVAGRYSFQRIEEEAVLHDIQTKLAIDTEDELLEIGCGVGNLLLPLSRLARSVVGVDHPACLDVLRRSEMPDNVELVPGPWPDVDLHDRFTKILVYSVLHYLGGAEAAFAFIDACVDTLIPGGRVLLGDLPNPDAARRFKATAFGETFTRAWTERVALEMSDEDRQRDALMANVDVPADTYLGDEFVLTTLDRYRRRGYEAYVLPQPVGLPFCYTREDILIAGRR